MYFLHQLGMEYFGFYVLFVYGWYNFCCAIFRFQIYKSQTKNEGIVGRMWHNEYGESPFYVSLHHVYTPWLIAFVRLWRCSRWHYAVSKCIKFVTAHTVV